MGCRTSASNSNQNRQLVIRRPRPEQKVIFQWFLKHLCCLIPSNAAYQNRISDEIEMNIILHRYRDVINGKASKAAALPEFSGGADYAHKLALLA